MIHGGGHMTLSRKAIRPLQTAFLLAHNVLPVSIDYRLCPEINLVDGPIADVNDAYSWAQTRLQAIVRSKGVLVDTEKIVVIGWSTGGHLAMTTAWKSKQAGTKPPVAILSFYGPTDFESGGESPIPFSQDSCECSTIALHCQTIPHQPRRLTPKHPHS